MLAGNTGNCNPNTPEGQQIRAALTSRDDLLFISSFVRVAYADSYTPTFSLSKKT